MLTFFNNSDTALRAVLPIDTNTYRNNHPHYLPIKDFVSNSIYEINCSIVEGKYMTEDVESLCNTISNILSNLIVDYPNFVDLRNYTSIIQDALVKYSIFFERVNNIYGLKVIDFKSNLYSTWADYRNEMKLLEQTVRLNILDNNFSANKDVLLKLFQVKNDLPAIQVYSRFSEIHTSLESKVNYLIYKWYLRTAEQEHSIDYTTILGTHRRQLDPNIYGEWIAKILNHYEIPGENWINYFYQQNLLAPYISNDVRNLSISLDFLKIHNNIKYFKDVVKDSNKLQEVFEDIDYRIALLSNLSELEELSYHLLLNYSINNYYSSFCDSLYSKFNILKETNDKKIIEKSRTIINQLMDKYDILSSKLKGKTNNFFLDYKVSFYSIKILNEAYEVCSEKNYFIEEFNYDINSKINLILENFKRRKKWSLLNNNFIFKLDYSGSILRHNNLNVYYASSFTLAKVDDDIENRFEEVYNWYKDLKLRFTFKYEIETIHSLNQEFKKDNKRIIEVVTIFTAIISFIVGSIGAYDFLKTFEQAIIFLLCYGTAISIFIVLMYFVTNKIFRYKDYFDKISIFRLIANVIVIGGIYVFLFFLINSRFADYKEGLRIEESKKNDSVAKINNIQSVRIDSLVKALKKEKAGTFEMAKETNHPATNKKNNLIKPQP